MISTTGNSVLFFIKFLFALPPTATLIACTFCLLGYFDYEILYFILPALGFLWLSTIIAFVESVHLKRVVFHLGVMKISLSKELIIGVVHFSNKWSGRKNGMKLIYINKFPYILIFQDSNSGCIEKALKE